MASKGIQQQAESWNVTGQLTHKGEIKFLKNGLIRTCQCLCFLHPGEMQAEGGLLSRLLPGARAPADRSRQDSSSSLCFDDDGSTTMKLSHDGFFRSWLLSHSRSYAPIGTIHPGTFAPPEKAP